MYPFEIEEYFVLENYISKFHCCAWKIKLNILKNLKVYVIQTIKLNFWPTYIG